MGANMSTSADLYFHTQLQKQTTVMSAALLLAESAEALGWDLAAFHADIHQASLPRAGDGEYVGAAMGWRTRTVSDWVSHGLARSCPVGRYCAETTEPFLWDCETDTIASRRGRLLPEQQAVLQHYRNDISGGVTVPVRRAGKTGYVSWCSREGERLRRGYSATLGSIHLISHTFMRQLDRIGDTDRTEPDAARQVLTPREIECLTWAARGKTTDEIGLILHRSHETVDFHLSNAMLKLAARNRAHAVAIACMRGLIAEL
jgi:DNA-binding CsgD family transcriptional regulator